jgi:hypothetical protein
MREYPRKPAGRNRLEIHMPKNKILLLVGIAVALFVGGFFAYQHWHSSDSLSDRDRMLALLPDDANAVVYVEMAEVRTAPFFSQLFQWAPKPAPEGDYAQFLRATGFNYESDLDRLALSIHRQPQGTLAFAVVEGRFDRRKIEAYGSQYGSLKTSDGRTLFAVPLSGSNRKIYFTFLRDDRVAWANDSSYFFQRPSALAAADWRERFSRLAGTPVFSVLRQDSEAAAALAQQAPGGLHSPQLAALLAQLNWISIGAKPDGNLLRVGIEGECLTERTEHQLKELLGGLLVLAQMGLNDPKTQRQLSPALRQGYLELLQSADVQQVDRGNSKSVRVIFEVTSKLLEAVRGPTTAADPGKTGP